MSADDIKVLHPDRIWAGFSPDYDGVVVVFDPETPKQTVLVLPSSDALALGKELILRAAQAPSPKVISKRPRISKHTTTKVERERPRRLDS